MTLKDAHHIENGEALDFVRRIRACLPSNNPTGSTRVAGSQEAQAGLESSYKFDANIFERTCARLDQFVRGAQVGFRMPTFFVFGNGSAKHATGIKHRFAPDNRWCFRQDE